ncbi:jg6526 [Pararge aegeria aegeria]|uniref:Jg6526 protein n=1 Tax=Pararge aegeria aegeria TaxID=348720 RepID=A0A8S4S585_9NEOP|nr:jg6526 [Pararge aegeria aegeria]
MKYSVLCRTKLALICRQSFEEDEIFKAKCLLFESLPHRLIKRKGEDRKQKNIDYIIGVLRGTEPDDIPVFVARDLQKLPPVTFDHVDATRLLKDIVLLQRQVRVLQEKQDDYLMKNDFEKYVIDKEMVHTALESDVRKTDLYVNKKSTY